MKLVPIKDVITDKISGEWGNEALDGQGVVVIRTANFQNSGQINFSNLVRREIDKRKVEKKRLISGDIIIEKSGGSPTQPVGRVVIFRSPDNDTYLCNNFTSILRPKKNEVHPEYLFYVLHDNHKKGKTLRHQNKTTGIINLKLDSYLDSEIPLPPLNAQIRIAHLLGKVEGLIAQRKQHQHQLDDLLKSVFFQMFGDPVRNEKGWGIQPCEKAVLDISSGTSYGGEDRAFASTDEVGVLKISAVTKGTFDPTEFKVVNPAQIMKKLRFVRRGDFLFSRANTVELVAACCVVPQDYSRLFLPDKLWVLTFNSQLINPQFFNYLLKNERYRNVVRNLASGGHDSMLNISMKKFMTLGIPCPLIDLQDQFALIVEKIESIKARYQQSLTDLEALYGVLSQQAFKGELDLSSVPLPDIKHEEEKTVVTEHLAAHPDQGDAIILPNISVLLDAVQGPVRQQDVLTYWLEAYRDQQNSTLFSVQRFMAAAQTCLAEMQPEIDFELGAKDYEYIKAWVFEALATDKLKQSMNDAGNRIQLTTVQA